MNIEDPKRILIATDLTSGSDEAFRQAAAYDDSSTKYAVCHVVTEGRAERGAAPPSHRRRALHEQCDSFLPAAAEMFEQHGRVHAEILRRAATWAADMIVLGCRLGAGIVRIPQDSVAELVVRHTSIPVLVARAPTKRGTMLVATDLTDPEMPAVAAGAALARERDAQLVVMHAIDFDSVSVSLEELVLAVFEPTSQWNLDDVLRARVRDKLRAALVKCDIEGETRVAPGAAATAVAGMAAELDAELLVVGAHERGRFGRFALGSVAEHLVRSAPCSVLAVRLVA